MVYVAGIHLCLSTEGRMGTTKLREMKNATLGTRFLFQVSGSKKILLWVFISFVSLL